MKKKEKILVLSTNSGKTTYISAIHLLTRYQNDNILVDKLSLAIEMISAVYSLEGSVLENVAYIKYLGVTISKDSKWNTHVSSACTKANRTLGLL